MLHSCATTSYQPHAITGGYLDIQLDENVFRITFHGNGYTHRDISRDYALLRCAEVCLLNGFKYFILADEKLETTTRYIEPSLFSSGRIINAPSNVNTIVCYKSKPEDISYHAPTILSNVSEKYKLDKSGLEFRKFIPGK